MPDFALVIGICGNCKIDSGRIAIATAELSAKIDRKKWDSDFGIELKAERNRRLDTCIWTILPTSPLSIASQAAFANYRRILDRMTIDCETTDKWVWPIEPNPTYPVIEISATNNARTSKLGIATNAAK